VQRAKLQMNYFSNYTSQANITFIPLKVKASGQHTATEDLRRVLAQATRRNSVGADSQRLTALQNYDCMMPYVKIID
jgi:hypothetical protein